MLESCAILTTLPNSVVGEFHDRMPVILPPESYAFWLDPGVKSQEELAPLMVPYLEEKTKIQPVSKEVNNPAHDDRSVIQPSDG